MSEWRQGQPTECGYYLATWSPEPPSNEPGAKMNTIVSELWLNIPERGKPGQWWPARGYMQHLGCRFVGHQPIRNVIAWMPMPEPYSEDIGREDLRDQEQDTDRDNCVK